ncbi:hypothetical protein VUR80DRAFT_60 [Thermomyces stellatus]
MVFGRCIDPVGQGHRSSGEAIVDLWNNRKTILHELIVPQYYVDVEDMALLHVAAGLLPHVQDQRIFGVAGQLVLGREPGDHAQAGPQARTTEELLGRQGFQCDPASYEGGEAPAGAGTARVDEPGGLNCGEREGRVGV